MHFHGVHYDVASDGAYIPGVSGPGSDVPPGRRSPTSSTPATTRRAYGPTTTTRRRWSTSITGGMYGALSILAKSEKAPDQEFVVFFEKPAEA